MTLVLKCVFDLLVRLNTNLRRAEKSLLLFFYGSRNCSKWYYSTLRWVEVCPWIKARSFSVCMCLCLSKDLSMSEGKWLKKKWEKTAKGVKPREKKADKKKNWRPLSHKHDIIYLAYKVAEATTKHKKKRRAQRKRTSILHNSAFY